MSSRDAAVFILRLRLAQLLARPIVVLIEPANERARLFDEASRRRAAMESDFYAAIGALEDDGMWELAAKLVEQEPTPSGSAR